MNTRLIIIGTVALLSLGACAKKEAIDVAQHKDEIRQAVRVEIQKVVQDPERAERISKTMDEFLPLLERIQRDRMAYMKEFRDVDQRYDATREDYRLIFDHLRDSRKANLIQFLALRGKIRSEMTDVEWAKLTQSRKKLRQALRVAVGNF